MPYFYDDIESVYERSTLFVYSTTRMRMRLIWCVHVCVFTVCTNEHVYMYGFVCKSACVPVHVGKGKGFEYKQRRRKYTYIHTRTHSLTHTQKSEQPQEVGICEFQEKLILNSTLVCCLFACLLASLSVNAISDSFYVFTKWARIRHKH